jgi:hypothetical protein
VDINDGQDTRCAGTGCPRTFPDHKWGRIRAAADGWFLTRGGQAWCPEHLPEWYTAWKTGKST